MSQITLKAIAETLNISIATVSKAIRNYSDVSPSTKKKVMDLVESLDYTPNAFAVNLRTQKSKIIGVVIPETSHHFFSNVIKGILKRVEKKGYMLILMQSNENYELEKKQINLLLNKGVDGIAISLSNKTTKTLHLKRVIENNVPLVLFDKISKAITCSKVVIDDRKAAYEAVSYLINRGYRRIAHFRGDLNPQVSIDRFLGYKLALKDHNIAYDPSLVYLCNNNDDFNDGYHKAQQLIQDHGHTVDAIFTITDVIAIGALKYFSDHNIKIPEDIALFGFSNWFMSSVVTPALSTVHQPAYKIGKKVANVLLKEIKCKHKNKPVTFEKIVMPTELIIRNSC